MLEWLGATAFVAGVVFLSTLVFLLLRQTVDFRRLEQHNDVAGFIYAVVGIVYGVLLAFVVIVVWEHYADTERAVEGEANVITQIYRDSSAFPAPFERALRANLRQYAHAVIEDEWQKMHHGQSSDKAKNALDALWRDYATFSPQDANDRVWYAEMIKRLNRLVYYRHIRIAAAAYDLPAIMWISLLIGGATTIGFAYLFGTANITAHTLMIAGLSITLALPILLIWSLSHPFQGVELIDTTLMRHALELVDGH